MNLNKISHKGKAPPWIVAHRGAMTEFPENTRSAFDGALSYPIGGMEFDVQLTQDEIPVIYHNKTLYKINRKRKRVSSFLLEDLNRLDWGGWFKKKFRGERLLTFEEMLRLYSGKTRLLIEIKAHEAKQTPTRLRLLVSLVLQQLSRNVKPKDMENCFILSFDRKVLKQVHQEAPHLRCVLNLENPASVIGNKAFNSDNLYGLCGPIRKLTSGFVNVAHQKKLVVMTYSCVKPGQLKKAMDIGVDVIMTDNPGWLTGYLNRE